MILHFAYGSNMSRALMCPRCPQAEELGPAQLAGYRFFITTDGYASVAPMPGGLVQGLLWRLTARDLAALNVYEGVDGGLFRARAMPVRFAGRCLSALVYVGRSRMPGRPKPGYLDLVVAAAREIDLPPDYVRSLGRSAPSRRRAARTPDTGEFA